VATADIQVSNAGAAAGTSTATASATAAPAKKWSASIVSQAVAGNDIVRKPVKDVPVETINYVGAGYKVTPDTKVGFRQYIGYNITPNEVAKGNAQWTVLTVGTKFKGVAGSDDIAPLFWYYAPTTTALKNVYGTESGEIKDHNGNLRMDAEIVWTLTPKWQVSYYFNPRQSMVKKQNYFTTANLDQRASSSEHIATLNKEKADPATTPERQAEIDSEVASAQGEIDGAISTIEATTTLIHYGYVYYNYSDSTQYYGFAGMDSRATTNNMRSFKDHALLGVGASWTVLSGKLIINPEIGNEVPLKTNGEYVSAPRWLQSEDMSYTLTAALQF